MLKKILPQKLYDLFISSVNTEKLCEVRLRNNCPITYSYGSKFFELQQGNKVFLCDKELLDQTIQNCCQNSLYAYTEMINLGYIPCSGGIRVGVVGEGVIKNEKCVAVKNLSSICIRIPHSIKGICQSFNQIFDDFDNTLVLSKVGCGKTTFLREIARIVSDKGYNTLIIDDRLELSGSIDGQATLDVGKNSDIAVGIPKSSCYANLIRSMRPDIVITDEIFSEIEVQSLLDLMRCGIIVCASAHCESLESLSINPIYKNLISHTRYIIMLEKVGKISYVYDRTKGVCIV